MISQSRNDWWWKLDIVNYLTISAAIIALSGNYTLAQSNIVPDSTLGAESSTVTPFNLDTDEIRGGAIRDTNLFHSFLEFNVGKGQESYFLSPNVNIQNILVRVTGSNPSEILGTLGTGGDSSPNLFLINPNGIFFGSDARLNVGGSFIASTAGSLKFNDGTQFSATEPQTPPLLTVSVPIGLQFGEGVGRILNQSVADDSNGVPLGLQVQSGKTLALVGGDVLLQGGNLTAGDVLLQGGNLTTESGRIEMGSVGSSSLVSLTPTDQGWALGYEGVQNFKDIQLSQEAYVSAIGSSGGDIQVQGRSVTLTDGSKIVAYTLGSGPGGTLTVTASEFVELMGVSVYDQSRSALSTDTAGSGSAGDLRITTGKLIVQSGAFVSSRTTGQGKGGELWVNATESVNLSGLDPNGFSNGLFTSTIGGGQGGNITVDTSDLRVADSAVISARTTAKGNGGNITVKANTFDAVSGGQVLTTTSSSGLAGNISLNVSDSVTLSGSNPTYAERAERLGRNVVNNEGSASGLFASTYEDSTGQGGNLRITAGQIIVRDQAEVNVSSEGSGNAGDLEIASRDLLLDNQGALRATTLSGEGGNITLRSQDLILMRRNSEISTEAGGTGNGGNITIDTDFIVAVPEENSDIIANAFEGNGGNIDIKTQGIFGTQFQEQRTPQSDITASSDFGVDGVVEINTPDVDPIQGIVALPAELVEASGLIASGCGASRRQGESKFIVTGRGGLPIRPGDADLSPYPTGTVRSIPNSGPSTDSPLSSVEGSDPSANFTRRVPTQIVEATGWVIDNKGQVVLVATAPTPLDIPWLPSATCRTP